MANRLLRNIAISIGAGLAAAFARKVTARKVPPPVGVDPILTRLDEIESRVSRVEHAPPPVPLPQPEEIEALGTLVSSQSEDIANLREEIVRIERRNAEQAEAFGQKVALLERQVPAHIEASVNAKMAELEQKLRGEFQEVHLRTVDAFADTIEKRVVGRIMALESNLVEQSKSIVSLREKSFKTDDSLNRLLGAVERLCARAEAQAHIIPPAMERPPQSPEPPPTPSVPAHEEVKAPVTVPEPEPEPVLVSAGAPPRTNTSARGGLKPLAVAIVGAAILGLRIIR